MLTMEFRLRASPEQFSIMLDFMETHGDLSRPQNLPQGRLRAERQWIELTELLNSVGGTGIRKPAEKWKRVWSDWKTKTKKKASIISKDTQWPGGGTTKSRSLTPLEKRVLQIMGITSLTGHQEEQKVEFKTEPSSAETEITISSSEAKESAEVFFPEETISQANYVKLPYSIEHSNKRRIEEDSKQSPSPGPSAPRRLRTIGQRSRRFRTPLEQASSDFIRIEEGRLRLEEMKILKEHERDLEKIKQESLRLSIEERRNDILLRIADIGYNMMELLTRPQK